MTPKINISCFASQSVMAYLVDDEFTESPILQTKVIDKINRGKKVVFKFQTEEDRVEFLHQTAKLLGGAARIVACSTIGAIAGGLIGGPLGAVVGGVIGAVVGFSLGKWLANFLWENVLNKNNLSFKKAFAWFGLAPNRVVVRAYLKAA